MKKLICLLAAVLLVFGMACTKKAAEAPAMEPVEAPAATAEPAAQEPAVRPGPDKDLVILYTNDVHCGVDKALGYVSLATLKNALLEEGKYVALVDAGDFAQGETIGVVSKGGYLVDVMNAIGYDIAIPGNHEFDYGMDRFFELKDMANFPILSCNFMDLKANAPVLDAYKILEFGGVKVAFVGISTPQTITSSTPTYFQDDSGNWIYGFCQDETGDALYAAVQSAVDAAVSEGAQYVVAVGHCGIEANSSPWTSTEIIAATNGIDVFIDGHSHSVVESESVKNKDGKNVILTQTGTKLNNIGMLTIDTLGGCRTALVSDSDIHTVIGDIEDAYKEKVEEVVAHTDIDLTTKDPATGERLVRNNETNLGDLCADAYRTIGEADIGFVNGGGVRADIPAGDVTFDQIISVHPFGNMLCVIEATGQQVLDALEHGARNWPGENGGFLQGSGLTYEINGKVASTVETDENGMFKAVAGERRVQNVLVDGEPIDPAKTYTLAGHDYMLKNGGDGYAMFAGCTVLKDMVMADNQLLITYITENLGGTVGSDYAEPQGRITILD